MKKMVKYFVSIKYKLSPQQVGFPTGKLVLLEKKRKKKTGKTFILFIIIYLFCCCYQLMYLDYFCF